MCETFNGYDPSTHTHTHTHIDIYTYTSDKPHTKVCQSWLHSFAAQKLPSLLLLPTRRRLPIRRHPSILDRSECQAHTHTHTHTDTHTQTHTHTQTCTGSYVSRVVLTFRRDDIVQYYVVLHTHTHTHTLRHTHTHIRSDARMHTHLHTPSQTHRRRHCQAPGLSKTPVNTLNNDARLTDIPVLTKKKLHFVFHINLFNLRKLERNIYQLANSQRGYFIKQAAPPPKKSFRVFACAKNADEKKCRIATAINSAVVGCAVRPPSTR